MSTLTRYILLQIPGWAFAAAVAFALSRWQSVSPLMAAAIFLCWVVKDFCLYPFLRASYDTSVKTGTEQLVGCVGFARCDLEPRGHIAIRGELWRAETLPGTGAVVAGDAVEVVRAQGLTLIVRRSER